VILRFFFSDKIKFQSRIVREPRNQIKICENFFELFLIGQKFGSTENFQNGRFKKKIIFDGTKSLYFALIFKLVKRVKSDVVIG
jgi:hypothetical protein